MHAEGTDFFTALWATRAGNVFTTHTPVAVAFDTFPRALLENYAPTVTERLGIGPGEISLTVGLFGAEPWGEGMRGEIERKLGIDAIDIYGLTEVMGPGVACECIETKDGPVI